MKKAVNIVWLKRDLRLTDHAPLYAAEEAPEDYIILYIFETSLLASPDYSLRHQQFLFHGIQELNKTLSSLNRRIEVFQAEAREVFDWLESCFDIKHVFSHSESGTQNTWDRDKNMHRYFNKNGIAWTEFQRDGILRGVNNRLGWDKAWYTYMHQPIIQNELSESQLGILDHLFAIEAKFLAELKSYPTSFQRPGPSLAWKYLRSFAQERGKHYGYHISKPTESRTSCGRISPYLAWGNLSVREAYQFVKTHKNYALYKRSFQGMLTRLKWHCHFIQKFEMECSYETVCVNSGYESMEYENLEKKLNGWKEGKTGLPLVDACMRCLKETGWINFRMRAMLVSVLCHHLDCDWRLGVYHLAQYFLDYEPGIHFTQFQMQAGTTGVNTVRIYNPIKQSQDHDPNGVFIKKWVTELKDYPVSFIHEPWKLTTLEKSLHGIKDHYPSPIIEIDAAAKKARTKIWGHRKNHTVQKEKSRILNKHVRNPKIV